MLVLDKEVREDDVQSVVGQQTQHASRGRHFIRTRESLRTLPSNDQEPFHASNHHSNSNNDMSPDPKTSWHERITLPSGNLTVEMSFTPAPASPPSEDGVKMAVLLHPWARLGGSMNDVYVC